MPLPLAFVDSGAAETQLGCAGGGALTFTTTESVASPPGPVHCKVYVCVAVSEAEVHEPLAVLLPLHPPVAVQLVVVVLDHVSVAVELYDTVIGPADPFASKSTVGAGGGLTVTCTESVAVPPGPVHPKVYVWLVVSAPVDCVPLTPTLPDHDPLAVQLVVSVLDQTKDAAVL